MLWKKVHSSANLHFSKNWTWRNFTDMIKYWDMQKFIKIWNPFVVIQQYKPVFCSYIYIYIYIIIYIYIYIIIYIYIYIYEQKTGLYCCITTKGFQILINFCMSQYLIMSVKFLHVQFLEKCKFADEWTFFHSISEHFVCVTEQFWMNIHYKKLFTPLQFQTVRLN